MMAKDNSNAQTAETASTETAAAAPAADRRRIVLPNGEARADYIRRRWSEKASRSEITKELNTPELNPSGVKVPYQIVFQATKGKEGGPDPKVEAPAAEAQPA
jgi:hypothetical protein